MDGRWHKVLLRMARNTTACATAVGLGLMLMPAPPVAAASPVTSTATYSLDFQSSNQNMWGAGSGTLPSTANIDIIPAQTWNTSNSANNIDTVTVCADVIIDNDCSGGGDNDAGSLDLDYDGSIAGVCDVVTGDLDTDCNGGDNDVPSADLDIDDAVTSQYGGNISGSTSGKIGVQLNVTGLSSGTVNVNYPVQVTQTITQPSTYVKPGDIVTISSDWKLQSGYGITTQSSLATVCSRSPSVAHVCRALPVIIGTTPDSVALGPRGIKAKG